LCAIKPLGLKGRMIDTCFACHTTKLHAGPDSNIPVRFVMRKILVAVIAILLAAVVGYLALDRHDKNASAERARAFDEKFAK
jgi:hypothetical protein